MKLSYISMALVIALPVFLQARWEVLLYADSSHLLSHAVIKNITDLLKARIGPNDAEVTISIQLHCLAKEDHIGDEVYRYKVIGNSLVLQEYAKLTYDQVYDVVSAARWAFSGDNRSNTMIILWNHGAGVLNPTWQSAGQGAFDWMPEDDALMLESCVFKRCKEIHIQENHRGLMFQKEPKVSMTTAQLVESMKIISHALLNGRKIDILGMDMCMMSMLEIGYELEPYVHYMVGSQDCELEYGWDYYTIFKYLGTLHTTPQAIASSIVDAYRVFYSTYAKRGTYTHAATDLTHIKALKKNFNTIAVHLQKYIADNGGTAIQTLKDARLQMPRFCLIPMYTDLYTLYQVLENLIGNENNTYSDFSAALQEGRCLIERAVINHCEGEQRQHAHGLSIYFPLSHIDSSYYDCAFAKESTWLEVLKVITQQEVIIN